MIEPLGLNFRVLTVKSVGVSLGTLPYEKTCFCICKNKGVDQMCNNRTADQRLCFRYIDSTISLVPKYEISSLSRSSEAVQPGFCLTWLEIPKTGFSHDTPHYMLPPVMASTIDFHDFFSHDAS